MREEVSVGNGARRWLAKRLATVDQSLDGLARWQLTLFALAIVLQALIDTPYSFLGLLAGSFVPFVVMAILAGSLVLLAVATKRPQGLPRPRTQRIIFTLALTGTLAASVIGVIQTVKSLDASFTHTIYSNDGTTLDQYAAILLVRGQDPYVSSSMVAALRELNQEGQYTTPLRAGPLAAQPWMSYPRVKLLRSLYTLAPAGPASAAPEFESHVSYPAFSFLPLVPFALLRMPSVVLFAVLSLAVFAWYALRATAPALRPWLALLIFADVPVMNSMLTGALDVTVMTLVFLMWLWWERAPASTIMLGLALATKQQAWFFALFFGIFLLQRIGWRATAKRFTGAAALFVGLNLPFMLHNWRAWWEGVMAPLKDPMFPLGHGLVQLALTRTLPLWPAQVYTVLELVCLGATLVWYWRVGARHWPLLGLLLAMVPLWFAWRSLSSYFYFMALPMVALWLAWHVAPVADAPAADAASLRAEPELPERTLVESFS